jgi:YcxB-like protein
MTELNSLRIVVTLTRQDLYRANVSIAWKKHSWKHWLLSTLAFAAAASFFFFVMMSQAGTRADWLTALLMGSGLAVGLELLLLPLTLAGIHGFACYGAWNLTRSKPSALQPVTYEFSPDGIFHIGPTSSGQAAWTTYLRIRETSDQFLLYIQKQLANVLPKRAFQSEAEMKQFRQLVREHFHGEINFLPNP